MTHELEPCPFCNDPMLWREGLGVVHAHQHSGIGTCIIRAMGFIDQAAWNRRADLPPTLAQALALPEIAALVAAAKPYVEKMQDADFCRQMRNYQALADALAQLSDKST